MFFQSPLNIPFKFSTVRSQDHLITWCQPGKVVLPMPLATLAQDALDGPTWHPGALRRPSPSAFQAMPAQLR